MENKSFFLNVDDELKDLGNGVHRKLLARNEKLMTVEVYFEENAVGAIHSHPHDQISYIVEGEFEYTIGGIKTIVKKGDSCIIEPNIPHGVYCLKKGMLLDVFTPTRKDFL